MRGLQVGHQELSLHQGLSPVFRGNLTQLTSTRSYLLDNWSNIDQAIPQALGYPTRVGAGNLSRYLPHQDPKFPFLVATSFQTRNLGAAASETQEAGPGNFYAQIQLDLDMEKPPYFIVEDDDLDDIDTENVNGLGPRWAPEIDRYVEYMEQPEGSYITPPATSGMMAWAKGQTGLGITDNQTFPQSWSTIVGEANITLRWHQIPDDALPINAIYNCLGCTNQTAFGSKSDTRIGFNPWTMLFLGASFTRIVLSNGDFGWTVEYLFKFSGNQHRWNYYLNSRANTPDFYEASLRRTTDGGTTFTGDAIFFDPGSSGATPTATKNLLSYNLANLNDLFSIA